jgi:hypothetical protein
MEYRFNSPFFLPALSSQKCSRHRLEALQDNVTQHCDLYVKFSLLTFTGQYSPFVTLLPSGSTNPFTLHSRQRAFSHIDANELNFFSLLTLFRCFLTRLDPYRIRSRCSFLERTLSLKIVFLVFILHENSWFHLVSLPTTFSRVSDAFSPFILTPFAVTGRPGSPNLNRIPIPSTVVTETGV